MTLKNSGGLNILKLDKLKWCCFLSVKTKSYKQYRVVSGTVLNRFDLLFSNSKKILSLSKIRT